MTHPDLNTGIRYLKGVGEKRAEAFAKLGIFTVGDLLNFFPRDYEDRRKTLDISELRAGDKACIRASISSAVKTRKIRNGFTLTEFRAVDESGGINIVYFNQKYVADKLSSGDTYIFFGKVEERGGRLTMTNPTFESEDSSGVKTGAILPVYSLTAGISADVLRGAIRNAINEFSGSLPECLPEDIRRKYKLCHVGYSYREIHFPSSEEELEIAKRRLVFEELFILSLGLMHLRGRRDTKAGIAIKNTSADDFFKSLPFEMTKAQMRVCGEISCDMQKPKPMNRIVQGDVGSGKTAVAAYTAYLAYINGIQTALMVPTEILAEQHFLSLSEQLSSLGMRVSLLTGSTRAAEKRKIKEACAAGDIDLLIGTHAVISEDVEFQKLGLMIVDEQHRFGVRQRAALATKGENPHELVMSATPIPRSLALIMYGDLDISVIDELPPGRLPVDTLIVNDSKRADAYEFIKRQLEEGHQAYIVCPLIDENEESELRSAEQFAKEISETVFSGKNVEVLHGKLKQKEKDAVMRRFVSGETSAIVSTTVIEVGVNVPNATVMAIENSERFGLSQLHQLRGRVGRGQAKSYCILFSNVGRWTPAGERLSALRASNDGFKISEEDLRLRGPGDFFGTRQHGLPTLKIASFMSDMKVLEAAKAEAERIVEADRDLNLPEHKQLKIRIREMFDVSDNKNSFN
ncbi:MAG: ATP-dependent DNA helicase RecG [Oscillospiraceae bacterium]|nr:ATP-dependent DNA helicase RecG [Oscillospiraceae bacterium]